VKLLFDENLSHRLVALLAREFPESRHVRDVGLVGAPDPRIWVYAREAGFVIASKDNDFRQRSVVEGAPPKVIWLSVGTDGTAAVATLLRRARPEIERFADDQGAALLVLSRMRGTS